MYGDSRAAYEVARKEYLVQFTQKEGKIKINNATGMNEGTAQAFITIFLAMINGEEYERVFNNDTNKFLLESTRKDYGEDSF